MEHLRIDYQLERRSSDSTTQGATIRSHKTLATVSKDVEVL